MPRRHTRQHQSAHKNMTKPLPRRSPNLSTTVCRQYCIPGVICRAFAHIAHQNATAHSSSYPRTRRFIPGFTLLHCVK